MPQVRIKKDNDNHVIKPYTTLKELLLESKKLEAVKTFETSNLSGCWVELLHYAMIRGNCPVSSLIVEQVISKKLLSKNDLLKKVRTIDQDVSLVFSTRVMNYINSGKFDAELEKLAEVRGAVDKVMTSRAGLKLLHSEAFKVT